MNNLKLFSNRKPIKPVRPLKLKPEKFIKTAVNLALIGVAVGIGLGAYKEATS